MTTAVLYARQSRTDDPDRSASLDTQLEDLRALAARRGWTVAGTFRDPDAPADSLDRRAAWMDLLDYCDSHDVDVVAAFDVSRLWRSVEMQLVTCKHLAGAGVTTIATPGGDTSTDPRDNPESGFVATVLAATAELDNRMRSLKLRNTNRKHAQSGKPMYGGTRAYGYGDDRVTVVEHEAEIVREAAQRVLAGESVGGICNALTRRGATTVTGRPWRTTVLRRVLTAPRTAGLREHDGNLYDGVWPPLLDRDTWDQVRAVLLDPARRKGGRPRAYLLTGGTAVCGRQGCGAPLVARPKADGRRCYVCTGGTQAGFTGCGKIRQLADPLEDEIRDRIVARLDGDGLRKALAELQRDDRGGLVTELRETERRLEDLEVDHYARKVTDRGYQTSRGLLVADIERLRTALSRVDHSKVLVDLLASEQSLRATWDAASTSMAWRRLVVAAVIIKVTVHPAVKGRNYFDGARVRVKWRV